MGRATILFGLVMFAAGIAVGALIGILPGGSGPSAPREMAAAPSTSDPASDAGVPSPAHATPSPAAVPSVAASPGPQVPASLPEEGGGSITGSVAGPDGALLAGVLVRATPIDPWKEMREKEEGRARIRPPGSPPPRLDVDEEVRDYARQLARQEAGIREGATDASGAFVLRGLSAKGYILEAWLAGFEIERSDAFAWKPVPPGSRCDFRATPIHRIAVSVTLPDGVPPEQAVITWKPVDGGEEGRATWKQADPGIEVPPGTFEFRAWAGRPGEALSTWEFLDPGSGESSSPEDAASYSSPPQTATVGEDDAKALSFPLESRSGILAKLSFEGSRRPRSVRIAAMRLEGPTGGDPEDLLGDQDVRARWIDDEPEGILQGLEPGTWLVGATFRGGQIGAFATVTVAGGLAIADLRVPDMDPMDSIRVRVLAPDGKPVRDVSLEAGCRGSEESDSVEVKPLPEEDGSFLVEHYAWRASIRGGGFHYYGDPPGPGPLAWFIRATSAKHGVATGTYRPATDREVTLRFAAPAVLRVVVPGLVASPRRDRAVLELDWAGEGDDDRDDLEVRLDSSGTAVFPPAAPGRYELSLHLAAGSNPEDLRRATWAGTRVARLPLDLPSGETTVTVPLPSYCDLVVTYEGDAPRLQRIGPDGGPDGEEDGQAAAGTITFRDVPEGRVRLFDPRRGAVFLDLPAPGPVSFQPVPFDAFRLEVEGEGYVHDLGLKTGDLVVAIEGMEFRDKDAMARAMATALLRGTAGLSIRRDGTTFEVAVDVRRLMEDGGSDYEPWTR